MSDPRRRCQAWNEKTPCRYYAKWFAPSKDLHLCDKHKRAWCGFLTVERLDVSDAADINWFGDEKK